MITYTDIGVGEELVLIHGLGCKREMWNPQLQLSENYRLIIVELRGHGDSKATDNLTIEQFAKDVIAVLDHLNIEKVHICGLSLGGLIAQEIHKRHKDRVKSLILANTVFYIPRYVGNHSLTRTRKILNLGEHNKQIEEFLNTSLYDKSNETNKQLVSDSFSIRSDTYYKSAQSAFGRNYMFSLMGADAPVLIIGSFEDKVTPMVNSYTMHCMIRKSKLVTFQRTGHLSNIEKSEEFNKAVSEHIESYLKYITK